MSLRSLMKGLWLVALAALLCPASTVRAQQGVEGDEVGRPGLSDKPWRLPRSRLPDRLALDDDDLRLPGAAINGRGSVRALVLPVHLTRTLPAWTDTAVATHLFGTPTPDERAPGAAGRLAAASEGLLRLDASVFPSRILPPTARAASDSAGAGPLPVDRLHAILDHWAQRTDLARFDNDGPDGLPFSQDDDGRLDLVVFVVEREGPFALHAVRLDTVVPVGPRARQRARVDLAYVIAVPRRLPTDPGVGALLTTRMTLSAAGLAPSEMFFPSTYPRRIASTAAVRLGWERATFADHSDRYRLKDGHTLVVPVVDVANHRGLWLIEREGLQLFLSRLARRADGHFAVVDRRRFWVGDPELVVPLTATEGEGGPRMRIRWPGGDRPPLIGTALSASAARRGLDRPAH